MIVDFKKLIGETIIEINGLEQYSDHVIFKTESGNTFIMFHEQDCCEKVSIEDIIGDSEYLLNSKVLDAYESTNSDLPLPNGEDKSHTWTFYTIATTKGYITIRWLGTSTGYYSEKVTLSLLDNIS